MKPRTKFQQQVAEASKKLPQITQNQIDWAYQNCIQHYGKKTKKGVVSCLECGHSWTDKEVVKHCVCPNCNMKISIIETLQRVFKQTEYLCIISICNGFQVLRFFYVDCYAKVGKKAEYFHSEVSQKWIAPNGKFATIAKLRIMSYYRDVWNFGSKLELRQDNRIYSVMPTCTYPKKQVIPQLKRYGFKGNFHEIAPFELFQTLLTENKAETLMKIGETKLLQYFAVRGFRNIDKYWASIRICVRNNYKISDVSIWRDYIDLLYFFNKDLHNAKYVCPADLKAEHDRYVKKKQQYIEKQRNEESKIKALEDEETFKALKSKFFGLYFSDGEIQVRVLESVREIYEEGKVMHHCVFANDYHLKPDSLILSASIEDKKLETIEVSLSQCKVLQSRGVYNKNTDYHNRILKLVTKHIPEIRKRVTA